MSDFSACSYAWRITGHGDWSSTCSANATRDTVSRCARQDGETADEVHCAGQPKPAPETAEVVTSCTFAWTLGVWSDYVPTCSATASRTRTTQCRRSDDTVADDARCGTAPPKTETAAAYSGCSYAAEDWSAWTYASHCSSSTSRTRTAKCRRSDGTIVDGGVCVSNGVPVTSIETGVENYSGCSYQWQYGAWTTASTCSSSTYRSRTATCVRSIDKELVAVPYSWCSGVAIDATTQSGVSETSGCTYIASYGAWSMCSGGKKTRAVVACTRSDGTKESELSKCGPADSQSCTTRCGMLAQHRYPRVNSGYSATTTVISRSTSSLAAAQEMCEAHSASAACAWDGANVTVWSSESMQLKDYGAGTGWDTTYGALCKAE